MPSKKASHNPGLSPILGQKFDLGIAYTINGNSEIKNEPYIV